MGLGCFFLSCVWVRCSVCLVGSSVENTRRMGGQWYGWMCGCCGNGERSIALETGLQERAVRQKAWMEGSDNG
ncbi:hypothetical protein HDK90DRAFT_493172 [Phyllosticta capitalensis]|uniref:Secreted protein n=1 Tax=Phyllosticta capitalensis TaxID=121624 RepID=A0ABR1YGG3_9PEZI